MPDQWVQGAKYGTTMTSVIRLLESENVCFGSKADLVVTNFHVR
jgi:hypothetical protein